MATMTTFEGQFLLEHTVTGAGQAGVVLSTENKFVDKNIGIHIHTPGAGNPSLSLKDDGQLVMGSASNGVYSPSIGVNGTIQFPNAGWVSGSTYTVADSSVNLGTINQSILQNGTSVIASGATITPSDSNQTVNITEGYNSARTIVVGAAASGSAGAYEASVGTHTVSQAPSVTGTLSGTISNIGTASQPTGTDGTDYWTITPTGTTAAGISTAAGTATITSAGYLSTGSVNSSNHTIAINPTVTSGEPRYIVKGTITNNVSSGTTVGTVNRGKRIKIGAGYYPSDVYYIAQANSGTLSLSPTATTTVSCDGKQNVSITLNAASFNNTASNGVSYATVSGPAIISGDYLYINAGYVPNQKISLADLVPDQANVGAVTTHTGILSGVNAYNIDGQIVAGSMTTYNGDYVIS